VVARGSCEGPHQTEHWRGVWAAAAVQLTAAAQDSIVAPVAGEEVWDESLEAAGAEGLGLHFRLREGVPSSA
jgi:hypothetical protein